MFGVQVCTSLIDCEVEMMIRRFYHVVRGERVCMYCLAVCVHQVMQLLVYLARDVPWQDDSSLLLPVLYCCTLCFYVDDITNVCINSVRIH